MVAILFQGGLITLFVYGTILTIVTIIFFAIYKLLLTFKMHPIINNLIKIIVEYMTYICMIFLNYIACCILVLTVAPFFGVHSLDLQKLYSLQALIICVGLSLTPFSEVLYRTFMTRHLSKREYEKIGYILDEVLEKATANGFNIKKLNVRIMNGKCANSINAFALGGSTLILTKKFIDCVDIRLMSGVFAHEIGHFRYGDSKKTLFIFSINLLTLVVLYSALVMDFLSKLVKLVPFINIFVMLMAGVIVMNLWIIKKYKYLLSYVLMDLSRMHEYRADAYAKQLGYGYILAQYLDEYAVSFKDNTFLDTHPCTELRIDALT